MKKHNFFKRTVCIAAAAAALFTSAAIPFPAAAAEDGDTTETQKSTLPTHLMNGDFEAPSIQKVIDSTTFTQQNTHGTTAGTYNYNSNTYIINNNVNATPTPQIVYRWNDPWFVASSDVFNDISDNNFYWETTASDGGIELALGTAPAEQNYFKDTNAAAERDQFAELVATEMSSLYQNIQTEPGNTLTWSLNHRARYNNDNEDAIDSMAVFIGPAQSGYKKQEGGNNTINDIFMQMAKLITVNEGELTAGNMSTSARKLYSVEVKDGMTIDETSVSTEYSTEHPVEWTCWIVSSDYKQWYNYSGSYDVPEGQTATTFAFTALTGHSEGADNGNTNYNQGNCLDNIQFGIQYPLIVTTMEAGQGSVSGGGVSYTEVSYTDPFTGSANAGSTVTITASTQYPQRYQFIGAEINDEFVPVEKWDYDTENKIYTKELTMTEAKNVYLIFAGKATVRYDANGGTLPESFDSRDYFTFTQIGDSPSQTLTQTEPPTLEGSTFLYWEIYAANGIDSYNETVAYNHSITYKDGVFTLNDKEGRTIIELKEGSDEYAIVLRAVYTRTVEAAPATKFFGSNDMNKGNNTGGTVEIVNTTQVPADDSSIIVHPGDSFTITATRNPGFRVDSWYYEFTNDRGDVIIEEIPDAGSSEEYSATYRGNRSVKIYALFTEIPINPYLSVVAKDETAKDKLTKAGITSEHGYVTGNNSTTYIDDTYGDTQYGNTIATGFFAKRKFELNSDSSIDISGTWTINIPALRSYFKMNNDISSGHIEDEPIVEYDGATLNPGAIYRATEDSNEEYTRQVKLYTGNTTITGGTAQVTFGIVIDNLYAPNAQAGFRIGSNEGGKLDNSNSVLATEEDKYDQSKLDAIGSTSSTDTQPID